MSINSYIRSFYFLRFLRRFFFRLVGIDPRLRIDFKCSTIYVGGTEGYGGWYVAPDFIPKNNSRVASIGIGTDVSFDICMIKIFNSKIIGYDPSESAKILFDKNKLTSKNFLLQRVAISNFNGRGHFEPVKKKGAVTGNFKLIRHKSMNPKEKQVPVRSIIKIIEKDFSGRLDLLKIDAEGEEYSILDCLLKSNYRPIQILVEFHHRFKEIGLSKTYQIVSKLKRAGYNLVRISDQGPEYTFLLKTN